jgi:glutaryl-CoA dehydrogenase
MRKWPSRISKSWPSESIGPTIFGEIDNALAVEDGPVIVSDTAKVLRMTRAGVAWFAVGCGRGAYEHALRYAQGLMTDEHASLAKAFCTVKCRETVGYARELLGGDGILLDNHVGRFVADAEAIYSYEGTREMNTLIVGKAITSLSAFV